MLHKEILSILEEQIEMNSDIRFVQLLYNLGIIEENEDKFYEESKLTLKKLNRKLNKEE